MADYYQLIARAVSALPNNSPEARNAIYERARQALLKQLRVLEPPISEEDIERETQSLEEAIARLEIKTAIAAGTDAASTQAETKDSSQKKQGESLALIQQQEAATPKEPPPPPVPVEQPPPVVPDEAVLDEAKIKESARPIAPSVEPGKKSNTRLLILAGVAFLVVAGVAGTALWLKQNPDDPARKPKIDSTANTESKPAPGKITERADAPPPVTNITPAKSASTATGASAGAKPTQAIPVATRSALLVEARDEPSKVKTYIGTVVWSNTSKATPNGTFTIMHGDVMIKDADFKLSFNLQKNDDPGFPADVLMDLRINTSAQSQFANMKDMSMPEMRQEETARGEALKGGIVSITPAVYMAGLSRVDREKIRNTELLSQRGWFDLPLTLADGRAAKLTIEKGVMGDRALSEALK